MPLKKFLIIGLGSMGKRRARNLRALGYTDITGFESRPDRRREAEKALGIRTVASLDEAGPVDAAVISTPPDRHEEFVEWSLKKGYPCFVELDILLGSLPQIAQRAETLKIQVIPSTTFLFHPAIRTIQETLHHQTLGPITGFSYHSGQYLPDWHPWESVKDYFVGKPETSGCMELLAFELHWMAALFGLPEHCSVISRRNLDLGLQSDDNFSLSLGFEQFTGSLTVDVVSRFATRSLILNLKEGQMRWSWEEPLLRIYDTLKKAWRQEAYSLSSAETGYNENISEYMYVEEMRAFVAALEGHRPFPMDMATHLKVLRLIQSIAQESRTRHPRKEVTL